MTKYIARGGTQFADHGNGNYVIRYSGGSYGVPLNDLLEFARHVEGERGMADEVWCELCEVNLTIENVADHRGHQWIRYTERIDGPQLPQPSRRTELLAMMAATVSQIDDDPNSLDRSVTWAVERAAALLAAVEASEDAPKE